MTKPKNLWGGRFTGEADSGFVEFNRSFRFDRRLLGADVQGSIAYCNALERASVLSADEANDIRSGLQTILEQALADPSCFDRIEAEDVHSFVEARLVEAVGDAGRKLHTGRSRNDQVATDLRLWMRDAVDQVNAALTNTQRSLLEFASNNLAIVLPGYTHLQRAQPVLLAHWSLAYFEMLMRDRDRFSDLRKRVNVLPLGSAALAGTSFPIDREAIAKELGFEGITANSLDAVSDRDFCVEFTSACSLVMVHLSRLAEDIILYSTAEFGFFELSDAVATGSSLMPQKKNPDSMELVRGKAGRVFGHLQGLLTTMKGLPLAYNKDMQEDKEAVFDSFDTVVACLEISSTVLRNVRVNEARARVAAATGYMNATELADYLVTKGMPFREAHELVGKVVMEAIAGGVELQELPIDELQKFSKFIGPDVLTSLSLVTTLNSKKLPGGTAPERVAEALASAKAKLRE